MKHFVTVLAGFLVAVAPSVAGSLTGTVDVVGQRDHADAVVYVDEIPGTSFPAPSETAKIDQVRMVFVPRVLPVQVGTTVAFDNSDPVAHNVFTVDDCADTFDLGNWTSSEPARTHTFDRPCKAVLLCNVHPEMEAYVVAVPTPYFAATAEDGSYEISDLPDGSYTVKVWHPDKKNELSQVVAVEGASSANFRLEK